MKTPILIVLAAIGFTTAALADEDLLRDPSFEALNGKTIARAAAPGEWGIPPGEPYSDNIEVKVDPAAARRGKVGLALRPLVYGRIPAVHQVPALAAGIYEFKVWARGTGILVLQADTLRRRGDLGKDWAEYSVTFAQAKAGPADLTILADGTAQVDDASLAPAAAERQAAWREQEKVRADYGFVSEYFAAQLPQPGAPVKPAGTFQGGPVTWREKVVFYDKTYDVVFANHPETLVQYLGANGFTVLAAAPFGEWMKRVTREGASGTVCVMTHGLAPGSVYPYGVSCDDPLVGVKTKESVIRQYLDAGGRVIWLGEMPFYYMQDDVHPQIAGAATSSWLIGVRMDYINLGTAGCKEAPTISSLGQAWGLAAVGSSPSAAYPEDITAALSGFHSDHVAADLAMAWFKNFNALCPWSGFIYSYRSDDLGNPALQESVYRLALYAGQPVVAPAGIVAAATAAVGPVKIVLDSPRDRHGYYRGEKIPVRLETGAAPGPAVGKGRGGADAADGVPPNSRTGDRWRLSLVRNGESFPAGECDDPSEATPSLVEIPTAELACGEYRLEIRSVREGEETTVCKTTISLCPRHDDPTFFFGMKGGVTGNPLREEMVVKDFAAAGLNLGGLTTDSSPRLFDLVLRYGLRFSLRACGNPQLSAAEREEAEQRGPNGEKVSNDYGGGRPLLGLLSPRRRQLEAADMAGQVKALCAWPDAWRRCETSDDMSVWYGWDYSALARRLFKEKTGLEAPVPPELAKMKEQYKAAGAIDRPKGIVPDNDPWLQWSIFTTKDITGGFNRALTEACVQAVPGLKLGPVPGGAGMPLWQMGQYPPHNFGPQGFNLIEYYYYLNYWQPSVGNLYWDEVGRMNNRDLDLWTMPDVLSQHEPTYYRNTLFLHLAGGCQGINYFIYDGKTPAAWKEISRLGNQVVRPLYPFLGKLRPVQTENGLLLPYTQMANNYGLAPVAVYAYANLLGAHCDVQPTCAEETLSGYIKNYQTILLWHAEWMRESVVKALENYIAQGGLVLADASTCVPIKGAIKLPVDFALGTPDKSAPNSAAIGWPGVKDYLHPDRVTDIGNALASYVQPWADCADPTLIVRRHGYHGVTYLWLVNLHSQEEYEYVSEHTGAVGNHWPDPVKAKQQADDYLAARAQGKRFTPRVTIPAGHWAAYDVLQGQRVPLTKAGNRLAFTADMERLGGTLIALYPEPIARVTAAVTGARGWFGLGAVRVARGQEATLRVTIRGPSGQPLAGTQPLAVTITTPQGEWPEITGAHATDDGVWSATIHPAINDPAGTWRIQIKELSSGSTGQVFVKVN